MFYEILEKVYHEMNVLKWMRKGEKKFRRKQTNKKDNACAITEIHTNKLDN